MQNKQNVDLVGAYLVVIAASVIGFLLFCLVYGAIAVHPTKFCDVEYNSYNQKYELVSYANWVPKKTLGVYPTEKEAFESMKLRGCPSK